MFYCQPASYSPVLQYKVVLRILKCKLSYMKLADGNMLKGVRCSSAHLA